MESGSNKSLFTLIAVVIFGIFLSLSYWLFGDELKSVLADVMGKTEEAFNKDKTVGDGVVNEPPYDDPSIVASPSGDFIFDPSNRYNNRLYRYTKNSSYTL